MFSLYSGFLCFETPPGHLAHQEDFRKYSESQTAGLAWRGGDFGCQSPLGCFFHYHPRVLDAWVSERIAAAEDQFGKIATVQQREVHVAVPVELDRNIILGLTPEDLKAPLARNSARLLIWGRAGRARPAWSANSPAVACRMTLRCACAHRVLPVMIEQDLNLEVGQGRAVLTEVIRGELKELTGDTEAPNQEMVRHLLKRKRILLIVDGL